MGGILVQILLVTFMHGQDLAFFIGERSGKGSPFSTAAQSPPSAHSEVTHPVGCGLAAWCKLALAKLEVHEGMLGYEYGEVFRVSEDIKISFILVSNIWNFILELIKFIKNLTRDIKVNLQQ